MVPASGAFKRGVANIPRGVTSTASMLDLTPGTAKQTPPPPLHLDTHHDLHEPAGTPQNEQGVRSSSIQEAALPN